MSAATFFIQKTGQKDDVVMFSNTPGTERVYTVRYAPNDVRGEFTFAIQHHNLYDYVKNLLTSLNDDIEPFDRFQLTSRIGPSVVYNVEDLLDSEIRESIYNTVSLALTSHTRFRKNE
jgi:hypothetical protein